METVPCVKLSCVVDFFALSCSPSGRPPSNVALPQAAASADGLRSQARFFSLFLMDGPVDTYMKVNDDNVGS